MSKKHKKVCTTLSYIEHFLILASAVNGCVSIFASTASVVIPIGITRSSVRLKTCAITAVIKKYLIFKLLKSITKKKKKKHDKILLLTKTKLNGIAVLISKALINLTVCFYHIRYAF